MAFEKTVLWRFKSLELSAPPFKGGTSEPFLGWAFSGLLMDEERGEGKKAPLLNLLHLSYNDETWHNYA